jgi:hypothetical protein
MRFLRLDYRDDLRGLDLHPLISVVSIADRGQREHLLEAIRRISNGSTGGLRGLIEHDGLLLELDAVGGEPIHELSTSATVVVHVDGLDPGDRDAGLCREIDRWERRAAIDAATVEEIRSHIDLSVKARARMMRARLEPPRPAPVGSAMTAGRLRVRAVRLAYDAVSGLEPVVAESAPEIEALIERWERYSERRSGHEPHLVALAAKVADAERAVTAATDAVAEAKENARPLMLSAEDEARLDELYDLANESSRWRKGLGGDEEAEMVALLQSVGVSSFTEYSVQRMSQTVPQDKLDAIKAADEELVGARDHLDRTRTERVEDEVAASLRDELAGIKTDCQPYLGVLVPSDIGGALRQQLRMVENPDWVAALNGLRDALASNDLHPPAGFEPEEILGWTDSWLRAQESVHTAGRPPQPVVQESSAEETEQIRLDLEVETQCLVRHERALAQIDRAERDAARSVLRVQQLRAQLADRTANPAPTTAAEVMSTVVQVAEQVLSDVGGSVPLAIVGDLPDLVPAEIDALMESIEEVAERVQVVVVSDNPAIAEWARRVGLERADLRSGLTGVL